MKITNKTKKLVVQFAEYMVSGGVWFWSGYLLIVTLDGPLIGVYGDELGLFIANFIGNAVGITLNFIINRLWVFKSKRPEELHETAGRYIIYTALNAFLLNYLILYGLREYLGLGTEIGQFIASAFFTGWNYFWYKVWVFKGKPKPKTKFVKRKKTSKTKRKKG